MFILDSVRLVLFNYIMLSKNGHYCPAVNDRNNTYGAGNDIK